MQDDQNGRGRTAQQGQQLDLVPDVEVVGGLVQHDDLRLLHQRPGDQNALAFAAGQGEDTAINEREQVETSHRLVDEVLLAAAERLVATLVWSTPERDHFLDREVEVDRAVLSERGHRAGALPYREAGQFRSPGEHLARSRLQCPVDTAQSGGLAAPVRADKPDHLTRPRPEGGGYELPGTLREKTPAHTHAQWTFSKAGEYTLEVQATATNPSNGKTLTSNTGTYSFGVGDAPGGLKAQGGTATKTAAKSKTPDGKDCELGEGGKPAAQGHLAATGSGLTPQLIGVSLALFLSAPPCSRSP